MFKFYSPVVLGVIFLLVSNFCLSAAGGRDVAGTYRSQLVAAEIGEPRKPYPDLQPRRRGDWREHRVHRQGDNDNVLRSFLALVL